eukprot:Seg234.4 transcript_id=Seg234.4/GoldUCD/mRNA.D3Y31 product="7SK snRNA methylphosphate capping enzyme" protein_id=Seg234.4/GoldUCD/D3Y31
MGIKEGYNSPKLIDSPLLNDRGHNFDPDDVRPVDITDPLKLNNLEDDVLAVKINAHKRKRRRRRRRTMSENDKDLGADLNNLGHDVDTEPSENEAQSPVINKVTKIAEVFEDANSTETEHKKEKMKSEHENKEDVAEKKEAETPLMKADVKTETKITQKLHDKRKHHDRGDIKHHHDSNNREPQQCSQIKFRKKDERFQYGNYNKYYGYRNPNMSEDDRIEYMKKEWFENKDCLDIGCNVGHLTLYIGRHYNPKSLLGIDIDNNLIKSARNNIRHYTPLKGSQAPKQSDFPISFPICLGPLAAPVVPEKTGKSFGFPFNTSFKTENYVDFEWNDLSKVEQKYDFILCLSVTKWIQLNWGDEGVKKLFKKIFVSLRPGGKLLLEPQPWKSYRKKKNITPTTKANFETIEFKPVQFIQYLLSNEIGFATSEQLGIPKHKAQGFQRPIYLLTKGGTSSSEPTNTTSIISQSESSTDVKDIMETEENCGDDAQES